MASAIPFGEIAPGACVLGDHPNLYLKATAGSRTTVWRPMLHRGQAARRRGRGYAWEARCGRMRYAPRNDLRCGIFVAYDGIVGGVEARGYNHAKPAEVAERNPVPCPAANMHTIGVIRPTTHHAILVLCKGCLRIRVRLPYAGRPLPDVAGHVERAAGCRAGRVATDRHGVECAAHLLILFRRRAVVLPAVAPGVAPGVAAARSRLPLLLVRQAHS